LKLHIYARSREHRHIEANMRTKEVNRPRLSRVTLPRVVRGPSEHLSDLDRVVSEDQAAEIIGYSKDTLRREFRTGRAPARVRLSSRRIGYRLSAIYAFLEAHIEKPDATA
jgi:predicted DNA-binding transcriptional regulator AlpA